MRGNLIEYNGEMLTLNAIANKENLSRQSLTDWYKKTNNIYEAVEGLKKSSGIKRIKYNGEELSLTAISEKENIKYETLKKFYVRENDIYKAVELTKEAQRKRNGSIEYNGKMMSITAIAAQEDIERHSLDRHYKKLGNIYDAIKECKKAKEIHNGTIEYNGKKRTISGIASLENIKKETLKEYYELYNNIEKAVMLTKESQRRRKESLYRNSKTSVDSFSKYHNIPVLKVEKMLDNGSTLEKIEEDIPTKNNDYLTYKGESLYRYCLDNGYNYWVIRNMIEKYKVDPDEALFQYKQNGQQIPHKWIYEKYGVLFKHLLLKYGFDSNRVIKLMNNEGYTLDDALVKLVFISDNKLSSLQSNWLYDLYDLINSSSPNELENIYETFYVDENEKEILRKKHFKIEKVKRDLLLFDISQVINTWSIEELFEIFTLYEITDKEIIVIYNELYQPFNEGIINPTLEHLSRMDNINTVIKDSLKGELKKEDLDLLSNEDKMYALNKIKLIKSILEQRKEYQEKNNKMRR